jgi:hypothetical protein
MQQSLRENDDEGFRGISNHLSHWRRLSKISITKNPARSCSWARYINMCHLLFFGTNVG